MRVIVTTCDAYHQVLKIFIHQFNRHWGKDQEVLVAGFAKPSYQLPSNFDFISLGNVSDYPSYKWSDALAVLLNAIDDEVFVLMLDDYLLTRPVNHGAVRILYDYMRQFGYVVKIDLCEDRLYAYGADLTYSHVSYIDLVKSMPGSPYHMSLWPGMWNRQNLLRVIRPNESAQDMEIAGSTRLSHLQDLLVLGTRQSPLRITNAVRNNAGGGIDLSGLSQADIDDLKEKGIID